MDYLKERERFQLQQFEVYLSYDEDFVDTAAHLQF